MKSILFFIESLDGGGAEGALENIVANLNRDKFDVSVVSETDGESRSKRISQMSHYRSFGRRNDNHSLIRECLNRIVYKFSWSAPPILVRKTLLHGKYNVEVAGCEGYATKIIGSSNDKKSKKIAWVHTDFINNPWSREMYESPEDEEACYRNFDAIVCVSETIKESFVKTYPSLQNKVRVIHNIVDNHKIIEMGKEQFDYDTKHPLFVLAGSFVPVKGFERATRVFGRLRDDGYDFSVIIMGIGYERDKVQKIMDELNLNDKITLMDYQSNPYKYMANSDAYVCSSFAEGYSTTVSEAVILGKPVITTECSGMKEIFGDHECGIICENSENGLYKSLKSVLESPELLTKFEKESKSRSVYFKKEELVKQVEEFLENI